MYWYFLFFLKKHQIHEDSYIHVYVIQPLLEINMFVVKTVLAYWMLLIQ